MMKRIAIYARKSVESDKGDSINIQINKCKDYVNAIVKEDEKFTFIEYKDEGYSGANTFRPDFRRLMQDIDNNKIDMLVCYRLDRITRSVADFSEINKKLERHNVNFISVNERFDTTNPTGRAMLGIIIVFAQLERETIRERITDSMLELAKTDRWVSGEAPLGYTRERVEIAGTKKKQTKLVIDEETIDRVKLIFEKYVELRSMSRLESYLLQNHIKSQNGKDMTTNQIALILKNPTFVKADERIKDFFVSKGAQFYGEVDGVCGLMTYGKTKSHITDEGKQGLTRNDYDKWIVSVGTHHGVIDADMWLEAQAIMEENKDKFPQVQRSHKALVSTILRCAECGSPMGVAYGRKTDGGGKGYYECKMRKKSKGVRCSNANARADYVDQAVINEIKTNSINKDQFLSSLREQIKQSKQELAHDPIEIIKADIKKKETQIMRLAERVSNTDKTDLIEVYENQMANIQKERAGLYAKLSTAGQIKTTIYHTENYLAYIESKFEKFGIIDTLDLDEQREVVKTLFKRITWDSKDGGTLYYEYKDNGGDDDGGGGSDNGGGDTDGSGGEYALLESADMESGEMSQYSKSLCQVVRYGE